MNALINYDGGENDLRTNIPTRFHLAWWLSASLTTLHSLKNNDLQPLLISIFSHITTTTNIIILRTSRAASPIPRSHNARSLSTIFHNSPCMLPARLLKSFDSDNQFSRRRSLSVHIERT